MLIGPQSLVSSARHTERAGMMRKRNGKGPPYRVKPQPSLFSSRLMFAYQSKSRGQSQFKK